MFQGFRLVFDKRDLLAVIVAAAVLIAAFQSLEDVVLPVLIAAGGWGADALGIVIGCAGAGAVFGALLYLVVALAIAVRIIFLSLVSLIGLAFAAIARLSHWPVLLAAAALAGVGAGALGPLVNTMLQRAAPVALRGRVLGAAAAMALSLAPITAAVSGVLIDAIGASGVIAALATIVLGTAVVGFRKVSFLEDERRWRSGAR